MLETVRKSVFLEQIKEKIIDFEKQSSQEYVRYYLVPRFMSFVCKATAEDHRLYPWYDIPFDIQIFLDEITDRIDDFFEEKDEGSELIFLMDIVIWLVESTKQSLERDLSQRTFPEFHLEAGAGTPLKK